MVRPVLNPQRLLVLQAVIASGSVNAAARNLHFAAATVSQHLHALARETGLVLFVKNGRGIAPTAAALHLADQGATVLADLARLDRTVADLREGRVEQLAVACFASAAQTWMPRVARAIREQHPGVALEISLNEPHDGRGRRPSDLDIRNEPVDGPSIRLDGYLRQELMIEEFSVVLPLAHPLAQAPEIGLKELQHELWIDHDIYDSATGQIIALACRAAGSVPRYAARLDDHHAALALVAAGLGITVLPHLALTGLPAGVAVRPLSRPTVSRRVVAHARRHPERNRVITTAVKELRACAEADQRGGASSAVP
jgi:DNA-binding transcriptional LysR family regulator